MSTDNKHSALLSIAIAAALLSPGGALLAQTADDGENNVLEEVVVLGVRGALTSAAEQKRAADDIRDIINAEDIGKLPDTNVAEALQRVTGVQIGRSLGEGDEVAVRGLAQNRVEINGQTQPGSGAGRSVTFENLPAEQFSSLEVIKTPTADETEGALGAIIRLNTRRPFDQNQDLVLAASARAVYADRADEWAPNYNALVSKKWDNFGALFSYTHNERKLRQDFMDLRGWQVQNGWGVDLNGNGIPNEPAIRDPDTNNVIDLMDAAYKPQQMRMRVTQQNRQTDTFTTSLQWQPSDRLEFYLDGSYSETDNSDEQYQWTSAFQARVPGRDYRDDLTVISANQTVLSGLVGENQANGNLDRGVNLNIMGSKNPVEREIYTFRVGTHWDPTDTLSINVEYNQGHGEQMNDQAFISSGVAFGNWPYIAFDVDSGADLPSLVPYVRGTVDPVPENRVDLLAISTYASSTWVFQDQFEENNDQALEVDFDYDFTFGPVYLVEFGMRYAQRDANRYRDRARDTPNTDEDGTLGGTSYEDLEALFPGYIINMPFTDLFDGASGDFPREWVTMNPRYLLQNEAQMLEAGNIVVDRDLGWGFNVKEDTLALYAKANFETELGSIPARGNFGVRYVETNQNTQGYLTLEDGSIDNIRQKNHYGNWLPSFNMTMIMREDLLLRIGAARAMSRPAMRDVAPVNNIFFFSNSGTGGNPDLKPEKVDQLDVSLEWYFGEGDLLSIAGFYKDFKDAIENGFVSSCFALPPTDEDGELDDGCEPGEDLINLATKVNSPNDITVKGVEIGYQQFFNSLPSPFDGFGASANYTYTDSDQATTLETGFVVGLQELSKHSANLILFYEKYGFSARAAYNWRDDYFTGLTQANAAEFSEPYGQLDIGLSYKISKNFTVTLDALNLINEPEESYQEISERWLAYRLNDTRYQIGLRARF